MNDRGKTEDGDTVRIGLISDVHGNLPALEAVLEVLDEEGIIDIISAGDIVGYYPWSSETIEIFQEREIASVMGNHDWAMAYNDFSGMNHLASETDPWIRDRLTDDETEYLSQLPQGLEFTLHGKRFAVHHAYPGDLWRRMSPNEVTVGLLESLNLNILVLGHSHVSFLKSFRDGAIINPGSVGQPRDGKKTASFGMLEVAPEEIDYHSMRVEYDIGLVEEKVKELELPDILYSRLYRGR